MRPSLALLREILYGIRRMPRAVLLVDDSPLARAATSKRLHERGVTVTAVGSTAEARAVDARSFAVAVLDLELGDGVGTDVAATLRDAAPAIPIVFLTGGGPPPLVDEASRFGPVFSKTAGVEDAIDWVVARVAPAA